jgi:hypothetical protein
LNTFTVTVTNSAPYFTVASFPVFESPYYASTSRKIIEMKDDESNPITLSATHIVSTLTYSLPSFITIVGDTIVSNPTLTSQIGVYNLNLKISDGDGLFST